jgi:predicted  nucleic acid-binding Zn-ribbon protein
MRDDEPTELERLEAAGEKVAFERNVLRRENERLTREKQEEFDIATGYHKKWQKALAEVERLTRELADEREAHGRTTRALHEENGALENRLAAAREALNRAHNLCAEAVAGILNAVDRVEKGGGT